MSSSQMALEIIESLLSSTDHEVSITRFLEKLCKLFDAEKIFLYRDIPHFFGGKKKEIFESSLCFPDGPKESIHLDDDFVNAVKGGYLWRQDKGSLILVFQSAWEIILLKIEKKTPFTSLQESCVLSLQNPVAQVLGIMEHTKMYVNEIEERKRIEVENKILQKKLIESAYKDGIAENAISVIHNIGNLLTPIKSRLALIKEDTEQLELIQLIEGCVRKLEEQNSDGKNVASVLSEIHDLLKKNVAKLDIEIGAMLKQMDLIANTVSVQQKYANLKNKNKTMVNFSEIIREAIEVYRSDFQKNKIAIKEELFFDGKIEADVNGLHYLVGNALLNAIESICDRKMIDIKNSGEIFCSLKKINDRVELSITDNGLGINSDNEIDLFKFGFTTKEEGNGFGLHNMANFVKSHQGEITLMNNQKERGACLKVLLPLRGQD